MLRIVAELHETYIGEFLPGMSPTTRLFVVQLVQLAKVLVLAQRLSLLATWLFVVQQIQAKVLAQGLILVLLQI